jgi:hypothetical protein
MYCLLSSFMVEGFVTTSIGALSYDCRRRNHHLLPSECSYDVLGAHPTCTRRVSRSKSVSSVDRDTEISVSSLYLSIAGGSSPPSLAHHRDDELGLGQGVGRGGRGAGVGETSSLFSPSSFMGKIVSRYYARRYARFGTSSTGKRVCMFVCT